MLSVLNCTLAEKKIEKGPTAPEAPSVFVTSLQLVQKLTEKKRKTQPNRHLLIGIVSSIATVDGGAGPR